VLLPKLLQFMIDLREEQDSTEPEVSKGVCIVAVVVLKSEEDFVPFPEDKSNDLRPKSLNSGVVGRATEEGNAQRA